MIRTDSEYRETMRRLAQEEENLRQHEEHLREIGLDDSERNRALAPVRFFYRQLIEEARTYEDLKRGELGHFDGLADIGRLLVAARIACGLTQRELAKKLNVNESQVSRDERNEYHGVTVERADRILAAMGVETRTTARSSCMVSDAATVGQETIVFGDAPFLVEGPSEPTAPIACPRNKTDAMLA